MCRPAFETEACAVSTPDCACSKPASRETTWSRIRKTGWSKVRNTMRLTGPPTLVIGGEKVRLSGPKSARPHPRAKAAPPQYHEDHFYSQIGREFVGERYLIPGGDGKHYAGTVIGKGHNCCSVTCQELHCQPVDPHFPLRSACSTKDTWLIMNDEGDFRCHVSRDELTTMLELYSSHKRQPGRATGTSETGWSKVRNTTQVDFFAADEAGAPKPLSRHRRVSSAPAILCRVTSKLSIYHSEMAVVRLIEEAVKAVRIDGFDDTLKSASYDPTSKNVTLAFDYCVGGKPVGELTYIYDTAAHKIIGEEFVPARQRPSESPW